MSVTIYSNIYPSLKQMNSGFCFCIKAYFFEVIGSKPVEFFLEYNLQDIVRKFFLYIHVYFHSYVFSLFFCNYYCNNLIVLFYDILGLRLFYIFLIILSDKNKK
jgi:hypothetical protein